VSKALAVNRSRGAAAYPPSTGDAYRHCEALTREHAGNFYYGICLLPRDRRRAMCAVYAFARRIDDIGDGELAREEKLHRLDAEERALGQVIEPASRQAGGASRESARAAPAAGADPVMVALADAGARFSLPPAALSELIEGVRMDVLGVAYERFEDLVPYCRRVAGSIGRLCLAIFGVRHAERAERVDAERLADDLGVAMQLTNILRDLCEDAERGRVYLPAEDLRRFGLATAGERDRARALVDSVELDELVRFEAQRAREWFRRGMPLVGLLDRRSAACVLAMTGIYRGLLDRIESSPQLARRERVSLPMREKAWVAARSLLGAAA
jgi:15-cis-phytoene synthase